MLLAEWIWIDKLQSITNPNSQFGADFLAPRNELPLADGSTKVDVAMASSLFENAPVTAKMLDKLGSRNKFSFRVS